jgi:hypothetical protein
MGDSLNNSAHTRVVMDPAALARVMHSPDGPVGRRVIEGAQRVQTAAKLQVRRGHVHAGTRDLGAKSSGPSLVDTIVKRTIASGPTEFRVRVGSSKPYALFVHNGTRPHLIVPRRSTVLVFWSGGGTVFSRRVHHPGTAPNPFLVDNLPLAIR